MWLAAARSKAHLYRHGSRVSAPSVCGLASRGRYHEKVMPGSMRGRCAVCVAIAEGRVKIEGYDPREDGL